MKSLKIVLPVYEYKLHRPALFSSPKIGKKKLKKMWKLNQFCNPLAKIICFLVNLKEVHYNYTKKVQFCTFRCTSLYVIPSWVSIKISGMDKQPLQP